MLEFNFDNSFSWVTGKTVIGMMKISMLRRIGVFVGAKDISVRRGETERQTILSAAAMNHYPEEYKEPENRFKELPPMPANCASVAAMVQVFASPSV